MYVKDSYAIMNFNEGQVHIWYTLFAKIEGDICTNGERESNMVVFNAII